jgi:hypothetical protein
MDIELDEAVLLLDNVDVVVEEEALVLLLLIACT